MDEAKEHRGSGFDAAMSLQGCLVQLSRVESDECRV